MDDAIEPTIGRPSKYKPEYCEAMIDLAKLGKSFAQIAAEFDVGRATLDDWTRDHADFADARARAEVHAQAWWENKAQDNLSSRDFNAPVWKKSVEARFRKDYTERQEINGGGPLQIIISSSDAEL